MNRTSIDAQITIKKKKLTAEFNGLPSSGGGGTNDYERLRNKPSIEQVELIGNKNFPDFGLTSIDTDDLLEILV